MQPSISDPFFTTKGEDKGTGLVLAIVNSILHKHKADMKLSLDFKAGTTFTLVFPDLPD